MVFVLVHGAYHGPWCWDRLVPELTARGHRSVTVDLPVSDPTAGIDRYADAIIAAFPDGDDAVVVGHSMGAIPLPVVAARRPVSKLVFLCPLLPRPGTSMSELRSSEPVESYELETAEFTDIGDGVWAIGPNSATELFYHDAPAEWAAWAVERLRPQSFQLMSEPLPIDEWPAVDSAVILCRDDHAVNPAWQRKVARDQLGVEAIEMPGGHSPFLVRPAELADILVGIVS